MDSDTFTSTLEGAAAYARWHGLDYPDQGPPGPDELAGQPGIMDLNGDDVNARTGERDAWSRGGAT